MHLFVDKNRRTAYNINVVEVYFDYHFVKQTHGSKLPTIGEMQNPRVLFFILRERFYG